ncbi:glucan endo-1,3-beta-glucosidase-like [Rhododendron vialii]|uniref:glucan endo-1,3-beta-glucosidase-like n=1 Tax=Rhododendron vialii TaxID=182163 RepID=UPI00265FF698|nr:glucan endo-1,3-beta-glucosidase-like [Rhododendron vialii]
MAVFRATICYCYDPFLVSLLLLVLFLPNFHQTDAQIGVCNGRLGNNLPSDQEVVDLYKSNGIGRMRMYDPNPQTLQALKRSNIELVLDVPNSNLQSLANSTAAASKWIRDNVLNYYPDVKFRIIVVGNEVDPSKDVMAHLVPLVLLAMSNVYDALASASLKDEIKVSTVTYPGLLRTSIPPSQGVFEGAWFSFMVPIINFLQNTNNPLLVNIYPYISHIGDPQDVPLPYALFTARGVGVQDGQLSYRNLFDVILDATYSAVEKAGGPDVEIVVSESGWPSAGGTAASVENAGTYYRNLINHVKGGSPKRPGRAIETYWFAMFDENMKPGPESERRYGLFSPNKQPKYENTWATTPLVESLVLYCTI